MTSLIPLAYFAWITLSDSASYTIGVVPSVKEENRSAMHRYLNVVGGFLRIEVHRVEGLPQIRFQHYGVDGAVNNDDVRKVE